MGLCSGIVLLCITKCFFSSIFCNHLDEEERESRLLYFICHPDVL